MNGKSIGTDGVTISGSSGDVKIVMASRSVDSRVMH